MCCETSLSKHFMIVGATGLQSFRLLVAGFLGMRMVVVADFRQGGMVERKVKVIEYAPMNTCGELQEAKRFLAQPVAC